MIQIFSFLNYLKGRNKNRERKLMLSIFKRGNQQRVHFWEIVHVDKLKLMQIWRLVRPNGQGSQSSHGFPHGGLLNSTLLGHQISRMRFSTSSFSVTSLALPSDWLDPKSWPWDLLPVCVRRVVFIFIFGWMSRLIIASLYGHAYLDFSEMTYLFQSG